MKLLRQPRFYPWILSKREIKLLYKYPVFDLVLLLKKFWITKEPRQKNAYTILIVCITVAIFQEILQWFNVL